MKTISTAAIEHACDLVGGQHLLADELGISPGAVNQWARGRRKVPPIHCPSIERLTSGAVTRKALRPDDWQRIWPELDSAQHRRRATDDACAQAAN